MADIEKVEDIKQQIRLDKKQIKEGFYNLLRTEDPKAQYICGTKGFDEDVDKEFTYLDKVNYGIGRAETEDEKKLINKDLPETRKDLSFLTVNSVEEGIEWYRQFDPKIPEELLPIMARWNWGDLSSITKKQIKNENKKDKKKNNKKDSKGIKIKHSTKENPIIINFN